MPWLQRRQGKAAVPQHLGAVGELEITDFAILGFLSGDNTVIVKWLFRRSGLQRVSRSMTKSCNIFNSTVRAKSSRLDTISTLRSTWLQLDSASDRCRNALRSEGDQ